MFTLHKLRVYQKALTFGAQAEALSASWGRRHAIVDHSRRASESIVLNIAEAARLRTAPDKARTLDYVRWFVGLPGGRDVSNRLCRQIDQAATSTVLNIAEGNGRYSELDQRRFLDIATSSATKARVYLDLYERKAVLLQSGTAEGIELLSRILAMLSSF